MNLRHFRSARFFSSIGRLAPALGLLLGMSLTTIEVNAQPLDWIETRLRLEGEIQAADIDRYFEARRLAQEAEAQADELLRSFDQRLRVGSTTADALERLSVQHGRARREQDAADDRAGSLRLRVLERQRQIEVFQAELQRLKGPVSRLPDPLSGSWRLTMEPGRVSGIMQLRLDGTLISGSFAFADGSAGSVRGTFVNRRIRLERISSQAGLDMVFEGFYDRATGDLRGGWQPTIHGQGGPGGGGWLAVRANQPNPNQ